MGERAAASDEGEWWDLGSDVVFPISSSGLALLPIDLCLRTKPPVKARPDELEGLEELPPGLLAALGVVAGVVDGARGLDGTSSSGAG